MSVVRRRPPRLLFSSFEGRSKDGVSQDVLAGLTLAAITIPEQMATAKLGGFEPQIGFYRKISGNGAYARAANRAADSMLRTYQGDRLSPPSLVAEAIREAVAARKPRTRYPVGFGAKPMLILRRWLSDRMFDRVVKRAVAARA